MTSASSPSVREIREGHYHGEKSAEDRAELWTYYVMRPLSFYPTLALMRCGLSASTVTWLSILALVAGCVLLAIGDYPTACVGVLLVLGWNLLDCVDGNIARARGQCSPYGEFLDAIGGYIAYGLLFFSLGLGGYFHPDRLVLPRLMGDMSSVDLVYVVILGSWCSLSAVWIRLVYQKFKVTFQDASLVRHEMAGAKEGRSFLKSLLTIGNNLFNVSGFLLVLLLTAVVFRAVDAILLACTFANTAILAISLLRILSRAIRAIADNPAPSMTDFPN